MQDMRELLVEEMQDLYDAEKQLVKALPKMVKAASNPELSQAFASHLEETQGHVQRLEQAFELLGEKPKSKPCAAMKGLIQEAQETIQEDMPDALHDSAIICAAQKVEHYEMSGYGTLSAWAKKIGLDDVADLLDATLAEERAADDKLTEVGQEVLDEAESGETVSAGKKGTDSKHTHAGAKRRAG